MERGMVIGIVVLILSYPVLFAFGMNKFTFAFLMYLVVVSAVLASWQRIEKGVYRVVHDNGEFVDEFVSERGGFFVFREHVIRKSSVIMMKKQESKDSGAESLQEYFH